MAILNATQARSQLCSLMDEAVETHQPMTIAGKRGHAVLVSEEDWLAIMETLYLLSMPNMLESIMQGMQEPISDCAKALDW